VINLVDVVVVRKDQTVSMVLKSLLVVVVVAKVEVMAKVEGVTLEV
jgi:hypothetical protein